MKIIIFKILSFLFFTTISLSNDGSYVKHGDFESWSVFAKKNKELCYTIAKPLKSEGSYNLRGRVSMVVARRPKEKSKNFVGIDFGYAFSDNAKVKIVIDKENDFELHTFEQTAWTSPKDESKLDDIIINAMIKGLNLEVFGRSERGTDTRDIYSLKGFAKAFSKIKETCG